MTSRLEYTGHGGENNFSDPLLIGKTILAVYRDGVGASKIVKNTPPVGKQASYKNPLGNIAFASVFEPGEPAIVLYKEGTVEDLCIDIGLPFRVLPDAYVGFPYTASFFVGGTRPINLSDIVKPAWLNISISGSLVTMTGTPAIADEATDENISFTVSNTCSSDIFSDVIDVIITPAQFTTATFVSGDRLNDVEIANLVGTPGVDVTITLTTYTNTNGGVLKVEGSPAFGGNTWVVTLDSLGRATLDVEINGSPTTGTTVIRGLFTITSVDAGTIGAQDVYQISKIFT